MGFRILSVNDAGTFGTVVQVENPTETPSVFGLKLLSPAFVTDERVRMRTRDEARILSELKHPNILQVFGLREYDGWPAIAMEWVHGVTLQKLIQSWPEGLPPAIAMEITRTVCLALEHAYEQLAGDPKKPLRLVHRDLKPTNVMVSSEGVVKIIDFGLAYGDFQNRESITISMVLGTRRYLAPERLDGQADTPKGDVYAIGIILLEMLIGRALKLSLNPRHHQERLSEALTYIPSKRFSIESRKRFLALISKMVAYDTEHRPSHKLIAKELASIMAMASFSPNINAFARSYIAPSLSRPKPAPSTHPLFPQVQFLENTKV